MALDAKDLWTEWSSAGSDGMAHVKMVHVPTGYETESRYDPDVTTPLEARSWLLRQLTEWVEGTSLPPSPPESSESVPAEAEDDLCFAPLPEDATLAQATRHWKALLEPVTMEIGGDRDHTEAEHFALFAVRELLFRHPPYANEDLSAGLWCHACGDVWPCGVYQVIGRAWRDG